MQSNTSRISAGVICSKEREQPCLIQAGRFLETRSTLNITTAYTAEVFDAIGKAVDVSFNESTYGNVGDIAVSIGPGDNGYISYNYTLDCYDGVIEKGCFDDIAGVPVRACHPRGVSSTGKFPFLEGRSLYVKTDEETALKMTDNPAVTVEPEVDSDANNPTDSAPESPPDSPPDSSAIKLLGQRGWLSSMTIMMTTMGIGSIVLAF